MGETHCGYTHGSSFSDPRKTHIHHHGCGFLVGVGVGMNSDTHGFTHNNPYVPLFWRSGGLRYGVR